MTHTKSFPHGGQRTTEERFGCHCDIESMPEGFEPDGCVIDDGTPEMCIYARGLIDAGKDKWQCIYWLRIEK